MVTCIVDDANAARQTFFVEGPHSVVFFLRD